MIRRRILVITFSTILAFFALYFAPSGVHAATITVSTASGCTLVDAITAANTNAPVGSCPAGDFGMDTISLVDPVTISSIHNTFNGNNGLPRITSPITIVGDDTIIQRDTGSGFDFRLFYVTSSGTLTLDSVVIQNGQASAGSNGGAIYNAGTLNIFNSTLVDNQADIGGAITCDSGTLMIDDTTLLSNDAINGRGGGIAGNQCSMTVTGSTIKNNTATSNGGGISSAGSVGSLMLSYSSVEGNVSAANGGGGIYGSNTITLNRVNIDNNDTLADTGGGIFYDGMGQTLTITRSSIVNNTADAGGGGVDLRQGTVNFAHTTISSNIANSNGIQTGGGGVRVSGATVDLFASTVAFNTDTSIVIESGIFAFTGSTSASRSIIASNNGTFNCAGAITDDGNNLDDGTSCGFGGATGTNAVPGLSLLGNHGGGVFTHALLLNSDAVDAITCGVSTDNRGLPVPANITSVVDAAGDCDIGAFERQTDTENIITVGVGCSIDDAIMAANTDAPINSCAAGSATVLDVIYLGGNTTYTDGLYSVNGPNALPSITSPIRIEGNNYEIKRDTGSGNLFRLFHVGTGGVLTLKDMTLRGGSATSGGDGDAGGAMYVADGLVYIENVTITENKGVLGGGVWVGGGQFTADSTAFTDNDAVGTGLGGAIYVANGASVGIQNSTQFESNTAQTAGAIYNLGVINMTGTYVNDNSATTAGAIYNRGSASIWGSTFVRNTGGDGGAIHNAYASIAEPGYLTVNDSTFATNDSSSGGAIYNTGTLNVLNKSQISNNQVIGGLGGGLYISTTTCDCDTIISDSTISYNVADMDGGGIYFASSTAGTLTIHDSQLVGNMAVNGGGLYSLLGTADITESFFSANDVSNQGAAIYNFWTTNIENSTFSGNIAPNGTIYSAGSMDIRSSTIAFHDDDGGSTGALVSGSGGDVTLISTLLSNNGTRNCRKAGGVIHDGLHNLEDLNTCGFTALSQIDSNPQLIPLNSPGGLTSTHTFSSDSPAIDTGDCSALSVAHDQRGASFPRPVDFPTKPDALFGDGCDVGALELQTLVNFAPNANSDNYQAETGVPLNVAAPGVLANDSDPDANPLTATLVSSPSYAADFTLNANGSFIYTSETGFAGQDTFTYRATDGDKNSQIATVTIAVNNNFLAPVALGEIYILGMNQTLTIGADEGVLANDGDADGNPITAQLVNDTFNGELTLNPDGSFTYVPNLNYFGVDLFTYRASDGENLSNVGTVTLYITGLGPGGLSAGGNLTYGNVLPTFSWLLSVDQNGQPRPVEWIQIIIESAGSGTQILNTWLPKDRICDGLFCEFTPTPQLLPAGIQSGAYNWKIRTWSEEADFGDYVEGSFSVNVGVPDIPSNIIVSPQAGSVVVSWDYDEKAAWYRLVIIDTAGNVLFDQWVSGADLDCDDSQCHYDLPLDPQNGALVNGNYFIYMQAWGAGGFNAGSSSVGTDAISWRLDLNPSSNPVIPPDTNENWAVTNTKTGSPTFRWTPAQNATWHLLWVGDADSNPIRTHYSKWIAVSAMDCPDGVNNPCIVSPDDLYLSAESYDYESWLLPWGPGDGDPFDDPGKWTEYVQFEVNVSPPGTASPMTPTYTVNTGIPTFQWDHVPDVTWYNVWIGSVDENNAYTTSHYAWHRARNIDCLITGSCTINPDDLYLPENDYLWFIQTYNPAGLGVWSAAGEFTVDRP